MISKGQKRGSAGKKKKVILKKVPRHPAMKTRQGQGIVSVPAIGLWEYAVKTRKFKWSTHEDTFSRKAAAAPSTMAELVKCIASEDRINFEAAFNRVVTTGEDLLIEVQTLGQDDSRRWIEFNASAKSNVGGRVVKYAGTVRDITRKKQTELELSNWKIKNELIAESARLLIYDYNVATGFIGWTGNVRETLGFGIEEMSDIARWEELIHPEDRAEASRLLNDSRVHLKPYDVTYRFRTKKGDYVHMHDRGLFVVDKSGEAHRMLGVMSDITEQVVAMENVARSERSYKELFNSVGEAIYIQDVNGTFLDVNAEACAMYGYTKEELIGKNPEFLSAPGKNDYNELAAKIELVLKGDQQTFKWWGKRKNGEILLKEVKLTRGSYSGKEAVIATAWDITEQIKTASSLQESEKRFERMIEDLNIGVVMFAPNLTLLTANRAAQEILRLTSRSTEIPEEIHFVTESGEELATDLLPWEVARRMKVPIRGELLGISGMDKVSWFLVNAEPSLHDHQLVHILITLTDITERKRMEEHWKESELRFRTLQEASFGGIGLHRMGMIVDCNQGLCDLTGYKYDELVGMNGIDLIAPEFRDIVVAKIVSRNTSPYDVVGLRKDGSRYFLEIHGKNIPYKDGHLRVTEFRDISDRKLAEGKILEQNARLLAMTEDLKQKNNQLEEFTQIVSHNLRSPVGNILSLLSLIENARDEEERNDAVELLKEAGTTTLRTLTELNQVLQIQQNKNIERQELVFADVFNNVKNLLNAKIAEVAAVITTDFDSAPKVSFPKIYLESVMLNLLSNALKYYHPGRKPEIKVRTITNPDQSISMLVSDNGSGLNMDRYGHQVFKLRKTFHRHPESRGIGLFMIKNQIEAMGGKISMTSVENEGSVFQIDFNKSINDEH